MELETEQKLNFMKLAKPLVTLLLQGCIILFSATLLNAQDSPETKSERVFKGKALYGFMNGGSDLFLEYGFEELTALEVRYKGSDYTVEIYKMPSPEDAFGIYSQHTFKCDPADAGKCPDCTSPMQFQTAMGNLYITVVYTTATADAAKSAPELAELFFTKYGKEGKPVIPDAVLSGIGNGEKITQRLKYARGAISLSNLNSSVMPAVEGLEGYSAWLLDGGKAMIYLDLRTPESMSEALKNISDAGEDFPFSATNEKDSNLILRMK